MTAAFHEDDEASAAIDAVSARRLLRYASPYRSRIAAAVALVLAVQALDLAGPLIVQQAIDGPLGLALGQAADASGGDSAGAREAAFDALLFWVGLYVAAIVLLAGLRYAQGLLMSVIGKHITNDVRNQLFEHLERMPMAFFDRNPVGRLVTRIANDVEALNQLFTSGVATFIADVVVLGGIALILFLVNSRLALVTLAVLPPLLAATFVFRHFARKYYREQRHHLARLNAFTQESIQGMDVIHLFVREPDSERRFAGINGRYLDAFMKTVLCYSLYFPGVEVIGAAGQLGILLWGGYELSQGHLTVGEFYLFWKFLNRFFNPIRDMAERYNILQSAMTASERIFRILDTPASVGSPPGAARPQRLKGELEFQAVTFSYGAGDPAIRGASFRVAAGEVVAIVGATGAGKSTIASLIQRFYEPQHGAILIDGVDVRAYDKRALRACMALVLQDPFIFTATVMENIRLGNPRISEAMAIDAARRVRADGFIQALPGAYHHALNERGSRLSLGERQLLSFARALARDPDLLILDEATSHIDTETERTIQSALEELLTGRTAIVIAHRLSTIQRADRILVLHKGELRESGSHRELLAARGIYYHLHQLQFPDRK
jgi:ATP-binding cassette subfamily B protein